MELEEKQILRARTPSTLLREWDHKEWWYTGVYDPRAGVYVSWYFIRVNLLDEFTLTVFDGSPTPTRISKRMWLDRAQPPGALSLRHKGRGLAVAYHGDARDRWRFELDAPGARADVTLRATTPPFTKFDNEFVQQYSLLHFCHGRASGTVEAGGRTHRLDDALVYYDHCFGRVPSQTGWHWLAVQNERAALVSLMNYGPNPQRYTQAWLSPEVASPRSGTWIRLEQDVSFEKLPAAREGASWQVTSAEMDVAVEWLGHVETRTRIPPLPVAVVDVRHVEAFVRARGTVRVDGTWVDLGAMHGVMEEHHGRW